jgi:hypothetical protein
MWYGGQKWCYLTRKDLMDIDLRPSYTRCRTYGHAWFEADSDWKSEIGTPLTLRCERCLTERRDAISYTGQLLSRHYHYSDGYQMRWDETPTKDDFRLALISLRIKEARAAKRNGTSTKATA